MSKDDTFELTRRKALGALGTIGVASAGAGLGTSAFLNDQESSSGNTLSAGTLDLKVEYDTSVDDTAAVDGGLTGSGTLDGEVPTGQYALNDVKPGDTGRLLFCPIVEGNPGYVFADITNIESGEGATPEPENTSNDSDQDYDSDDGELDDLLDVRVAEVDASHVSDTGSDGIGDTDSLSDGDGHTLVEGDVDDIAAGTAARIDGDLDSGTSGDAFSPGSPQTCIFVEWELPTSVGNDVQGDTLSFDVKFGAVQERNNDSPAPDQVF